MTDRERTIYANAGIVPGLANRGVKE